MRNRGRDSCVQGALEALYPRRPRPPSKAEKNAAGGTASPARGGGEGERQGRSEKPPLGPAGLEIDDHILETKLSLSKEPACGAAIATPSVAPPRAPRHLPRRGPGVPALQGGAGAAGRAEAASAARGPPRLREARSAPPRLNFAVLPGADRRRPAGDRSSTENCSARF